MSVELSNISFCYPRAQFNALDDVTARFTSSIVAVLGPNGAGKSTLLGILSTTMVSQAGRFSVDGHEVHSSKSRSQLRKVLGWLPQSLGMMPGYTAAEFLRYVAWMREVPYASVEEAVATALASVNLTDVRDRPIKKLSGGMRQRLGLAQALVNRPALLILDEPTVGLDPRQRAEFRSLVQQQQHQSQIIVSTHLVDDVASLAQEVLVLDQGRVLFSGTLSDMCGMEQGAAPSGALCVRLT